MPSSYGVASLYATSVAPGTDDGKIDSAAIERLLEMASIQRQAALNMLNLYKIFIVFSREAFLCYCGIGGRWKTGAHLRRKQFAARKPNPPKSANPIVEGSGTIPESNTMSRPYDGPLPVLLVGRAPNVVP